MSLLFVLSIAGSFFLLMPLMLQPLSLGILIMGISGVLCIMLSFYVSSWYGYVLFLIYVGGLLVMFAYVSALMPNNFFTSVKSVYLFFGLLCLLMVGLSQLFIPDQGMLLELGGVSCVDGHVRSTGDSLVSYNSASVVVVLGVVLLVALLAVVKICYYQKGPLRSVGLMKFKV